MSRIAKQPIEIPSGVEVAVDGRSVTVKGKKGSLGHELHPAVDLQRADNVLTFLPREGVAGAHAQTGTARALVSNMVKGVSEGFDRKLTLVGVGYRAQAQGKVLNLTLGDFVPENRERIAGGQGARVELNLPLPVGQSLLDLLVP